MKLKSATTKQDCGMLIFTWPKFSPGSMTEPISAYHPLPCVESIYNIKVCLALVQTVPGSHVAKWDGVSLGKFAQISKITPH
jgi:hypothetical protein